MVRISIILFIICLAFSALSHTKVASAADAATPDTFTSLDEQVQDFKKEVIQLNRELFILEEEILFPSTTQVVVFLSMDIGEFFKLDAVQLKIDDKVTSNYLYTEREVNSLRQGGVHRLYMGNLRTGEHELVALLTGIGPNQREYKRGVTINITKTLAPKFVELKIIDSNEKQQPEFSIREW